MHKRGLCRHGVSVCLSVRPSVGHVRELCQTNKDVFEIFSPPGSQASLVFPRQTGWRYSDGNPFNESNAGRVGKNEILNEYLASLHTVAVLGFSFFCGGGALG